MNTAHNPWQTIAEKKIYDNKWISLTEFDVINPSGGAGIYGVVHFKNTAVGVVPVDDQGHIWLVGQYRYPLKQFSWEIPEGGCPANESTLEAAARELAEETGIVAARYEPLVTMHLSNSVSDEAAIIYLATGLSFNTPNPEETEELHVKKVTLAEAMSMIQSGDITDSMSVAALQQVYIRQLEQALAESTGEPVTPLQA